MLSVFYLHVLLFDLREQGFHQLGLPVVAMLQLIADQIFEHVQFKKLIHLRYESLAMSSDFPYPLICG